MCLVVDPNGLLLVVVLMKCHVEWNATASHAEWSQKMNTSETNNYNNNNYNDNYNTLAEEEPS